VSIEITESRFDPDDEAFNEIERQAKQRKEAVKAQIQTLTEYERGYEEGFVAGVQKQTESAVTKMMNGGIRNDTIEEVAQHLEKLKLITADALANIIRGMKK
jgi:hypothetical protein